MFREISSAENFTALEIMKKLKILYGISDSPPTKSNQTFI